MSYDPPPGEPIEVTIYKIIANACVRSEQNAADKERAAAVKYLRERAKGTRDWGTNELMEIEDWISDIEEGEHRK